MTMPIYWSNSDTLNISCNDVRGSARDNNALAWTYQKYWWGKFNFFWGEGNVIETDKCMGFSQLLGPRARAAPKVYAYAKRHKMRHSYAKVGLSYGLICIRY